MSIEKWLNKFRDAWLSKDISEVLALFTSDVEYWENPFKKIQFDDLKEEWAVIHNQDIKKLKFNAVLKDGNSHCIKWNLEYLSGNKMSSWRGLYLVRLNDRGSCSYFYQVGEKDGD